MEKAWRSCAQMLLLVLIYHIGNYITQFFQLKIPGNVIGMLLLLVLLWLKVIKLEQIELAAGWLLKHLGFFFIPISVGLMTLGQVISKNGLSLLFIIISSAIIGMISAGRITQSVMSRKEKVRVTSHDHAI
ncbi:CidA/LrgA family protein [Neobacillus sp. FSL H8-0543]|uniref:CidA/LrgA family protein n=1 Tax=Neobacillus sp. FSL H8-0543 TaxID=2954672 RepID=UPI0031582E58